MPTGKGGIRYDIHFVTLPNGEIEKVERVDIGGYVDTDTVREMTPDEWHLLRDKIFRKLM